jgi:hypothetical protein
MILVHNIFQFIIDRHPLSFKNLLRTNKINGIIAILFSIIFYHPVQTIIKDKLIIVGGTNGFWNDTVSSLLYSSAYYAPDEKIIVVCWQIFIIAFFILFVFKCLKYIKERNRINLTQKIALFFGMIISFIVLGTMVQQQLFGTPFLMGRFALFIYPLFIFMSCFLVSDVWSSAYKYTGGAFLFLLSGVFFVHTCFALNTSWYYEWRYMSIIDAKKMLTELNQDRPKTGPTISLGAIWIFEPIINFYRVTLHLDWLKEIESDGIQYDNDYFFITRSDLDGIQQNEAEIMHYYPATENYLVKHLRNNSFKLGGDELPVVSATGMNRPKYNANNKPKSLEERNNKRPAVSAAGIFTFSVNIKAANQKYVCADLSQNNLVVANRDDASAWETFIIVNLENNKCAIRSFNFRFLCPELNHQNEITATRDKIAGWETFTLVKLDSNYVAFKAANEKYLSVDEKSFQLFARSDSIGRKERFELIIK